MFVLDREKLGYSGLLPDDILRELRFYVAGIDAGSLQSIYEDNTIVLSLIDFKEDLSPEDILNISLSTKIGDIRVGDYASFSFQPGLSSISREDGKISISVNSDVSVGKLPSDIQPDLIDFAKKYNFPE